jgi:hypothetical protein
MPRFEKPFGHNPLLSSKDIIPTHFYLNDNRTGFNCVVVLEEQFKTFKPFNPCALD